MARKPSRSAGEIARAKAREAEAQARAVEAQARAAAEKAAAEARAIEAKAKADAEMAKVEAEKQRQAAEAKRLADEAAAKERSSYLAPALTAALAVVAGAASWKLGRLIGRVAAAGAKDTIKSVNALGREAAKLNKSAVLAGTPKGDQAKAIVNEAYALGGVKSAFQSPGYQAPPKAHALFDSLGKPPKTADYVAGALAIEGAVTTGASLVVEDPAAKQALRIAGSASLAGAAGLKAALTVAKAAAPRPSSRAIASIETIRHRLVRESDEVVKPLSKSAGGKASKVAYLRPGGSAPQGTPPATPAGGGARRAEPVRYRAGGTVTYSRTYTRGPKAGLTETVTRNR